MPIQERRERGPLDGEEGRFQDDSSAHQANQPRFEQTPQNPTIACTLPS